MKNCPFFKKILRDINIRLFFSTDNTLKHFFNRRKPNQPLPPAPKMSSSAASTPKSRSGTPSAFVTPPPAIGAPTKAKKKRGNKKQEKRKEIEELVEGGMYDVDKQLTGMKILKSKSTFSTKKKAMHTPWLARGSVEGSFPTVIIDNVRLASVGKADEHRRGFDIYEFSPNNQAISISLGITRTDNQDLRDIMAGIVLNFVGLKDPITKNKFYQDTFPQQLTDGTKVHSATQCLLSPDEYVDMTFVDSVHEWDSPAKTFGPFLFSPDDESTYYTKPKIDPESLIFMYTVKGKQFQTVKENNMVVYPRGGIRAGDTNVLANFMRSDMYKSKQWRVRGTIAVTGISLNCGEVMTIGGTPGFAVAPDFSLRMSGPIVLTEYNAVEEEGGVSKDQRLEAQFAAIFKNMKETPSRKRKVNAMIANGSKTSAPKKKKKTSATVEESQEVEDDEDSSSDSDTDALGEDSDNDAE